MTWGEKLREARERQGYSLEAVEEETKIRKFYLKALENEDFASLPPKIYATGFVKRYARLLSLDEAECVTEFHILAYGQDCEDKKEIIDNSYSTSNLEKKISIKNIISGLVFLAIVFWLGNFLLDYMFDKGIVDMSIKKTPSVEEPVKNNEESPARQPEVIVNKAHVSIVARERCWLEVKVDGENVFAANLEVGAAQEFEGNESVWIKVGNAGGVDISFNGEKLKSVGSRGEVKEMEFAVGKQNL